jgi:hypothetical protein
MYKSKLITRSQTVYGSLVETYGPYLHDYTRFVKFFKSIVYSNLCNIKNQAQYKSGDNL